MKQKSFTKTLKWSTYQFYNFSVQCINNAYYITRQDSIKAIIVSGPAILCSLLVRVVLLSAVLRRKRRFFPVSLPLQAAMRDIFSPYYNILPKGSTGVGCNIIMRTHSAGTEQSPVSLMWNENYASFELWMWNLPSNPTYDTKRTKHCMINWMTLIKSLTPLYRFFFRVLNSLFLWHHVFFIHRVGNSINARNKQVIVLNLSW